MPLPSAEITKEHILDAISRIDAGEENPFADSTKFDVLHEGRRYPPKAVVGVAATLATGHRYGPEDFSGGEKSACFRVLELHGFEIVLKSDVRRRQGPMSESGVDESIEGLDAAEGRVSFRRHRTRERNRDLVLEKKSRARDGQGQLRCEACGFDFESVYGALGADFIECHHKIPISTLQPDARTSIDDLAVVCSNCHRMLHRGGELLSIEELRRRIRLGGDA